MRPLITLTCEDFQAQGFVAVACCNSCHIEDEEAPMVDVYPESKSGHHDFKVMADVCCNVADAIFQLPRGAWAQIIKNKRRFPQHFDAEWLE